MKPIAVFYHCLIYHNHREKDSPNRLGQNALSIIRDQMSQLTSSGLSEAAEEVWVGVNGGDETIGLLAGTIPSKSKIVSHSQEAKSETPTIVLLQKWALTHPDWHVFYFHSKGATHVDQNYLAFVSRWRHCMMKNLVLNWRQCVLDLENGYDSVGCHWMVNVGIPPKDNIWGGNFWWVKTDFLNTLAPITERELIKTHGVNAAISRYEAERFLGAGPQLPKIKDYHVNGIGSCP